MSFSNVPYAEAREIAQRQHRTIVAVLLVLAALLVGAAIGILTIK